MVGEGGVVVVCYSEGGDWGLRYPCIFMVKNLGPRENLDLLSI